MYDFDKRQQRIKDLLESMQGPSSHQQKIHVIDPTYRHPQVSPLPYRQQSILDRTLNTLTLNEQQKKSQSIKVQKTAYCGQLQRRLQNYVYSKTPSKSLDLKSSQNKHILNIQKLIKQDRIYLERKYNCKLSYELHNILQATTIEQQSAKMKKRMASQQQSALISRLERQTKKLIPVNDQFDIQKSKKGKLKKSNTFLRIHKMNSTKLLEKYVRPIAINKENKLKKYNIASYATVKNSPKK